MPTRNEELIGLMNDSVNSAVEFLKRKKVENTALRDIVLFLVQIQDAPGLFAGFRNSIRDRFGFSLEEVEKVYACFKIADHFSNGRWLWKRSKYISPSYSEYQGFLRFDEGPLEDFPFTVSFTVDWFQKAHIKPNTFVNRLNDVLSDDNSLFRVLLNKLQGGKALLTSDMVYCYLLKAQEDINKIEIKNMINEGIHNALTNPEELFQLYQILELPFRLKNIMLNSVGINKNAVNLIAETILNEYHANRQRINNFARESINHLLVWETLV